MLLLFQLQGMGGMVGEAPVAPPAPPPSKKGKGKPKDRPLLRFVVELDGDKRYFWTESEAEAYLRQKAHVLIRRAKAVSRKTHRVELPTLQSLQLPRVTPIPRFIVQGSNDISLLTQQINAKIDAILANPDYEANLDDEDIERLLNGMD